MDSRANRSFVNEDWVKQRELVIVSKEGAILQCSEHSNVPQIGVVEGITLENGSKKFKTDLEVIKMSSGVTSSLT